METAGFEVECLQHAPVGDARCGAHIIEGSQVTRLSFVIKVVEAGDAWAYGDMKAEPLDTKMEQVEANVAVIDPGELEISNVVIGRGVQVRTGVETKEAVLFFLAADFVRAWVHACVSACVRVCMRLPGPWLLPSRRPS